MKNNSQKVRAIRRTLLKFSIFFTLPMVTICVLFSLFGSNFAYADKIEKYELAYYIKTYRNDYKYWFENYRDRPLTNDIKKGRQVDSTQGPSPSIDKEVQQLRKEVDVLNQTILNGNVKDVLTAGRMRQEFDDRKKFEKEMDQMIKDKMESLEKVIALSEKITDSNASSISNLQFWVWGTLLTVIATMGGATLYLSKRLSQILHTSE